MWQPRRLSGISAAAWVKASQERQWKASSCPGRYATQAHSQAQGPRPLVPRAPGARARAACCSGVKEFILLFLEISSIHGFAHLVERGRSPWEYALWFACVCVAVFGCVSFSLRTLDRYNDNPTVISLERDYKMWNTTFPGATVCPDEPWLPQAVAAAARNASEVSDKEALRYFYQNLTAASYDSFKNFRPVAMDPLTPDMYQSFVNANIIHPDFSGGNISSSDSAEPIPVEETFTERGICFAFNSDVAGYSSYAYWKKNSWAYLPPKKKYYGNPLTGDRHTNWFMGFSSRVYLHGAEEAADCSRGGHELLMPSTRAVRLTALTTYSSEAVRELRVSQRRCRLERESDLRLSPVYTYNLCRRDCRRRLALQLCGCSPFFYRVVDKTPVCNSTQMVCLSEHSETLIKLVHPKTKTKIDCGCLPRCDEVTYAIEHDVLGPWKLSAVFKWGIITYPQTRLKRDVIFGFSDLLVAVGGTAGLFLGCSVLSFVEIVYFFTLRLFWHYRKRRIGKYI